MVSVVGRYMSVALFVKYRVTVAIPCKLYIHVHGRVIPVCIHVCAVPPIVVGAWSMAEMLCRLFVPRSQALSSSRAYNNSSV